jgi:pimeloyl-ACP methyl ester carboxylesterase
VQRTTVDEYVEDVRKFCDKRHLKNTVMIGHSMGGAIAQKFALMFPEYLRAIVLVCTGAKLRVNPIILDAIERNYNEAIELIVEFAFSDKTAGEIKAKAREEMKKIRPEVVYSDFEACDKFNIMDKLGEIKLPTLIACGVEDQLAPVKYSEYLKDNISNSKLVAIADAGHMVMLEKPEEFNKELERFVRGLQ